MEAAVSYLLMLQEYICKIIQSKKLWNKTFCTFITVICLGNVSKDFAINNMKK